MAGAFRRQGLCGCLHRRLQVDLGRPGRLGHLALLGDVNLDGVHVLFRLGDDVALLQVFVDVDFYFHPVAGDAADGMRGKLLAQERDVDDLLVRAVVGGSENPIAKHAENIKNRAWPGSR